MQASDHIFRIQLEDCLQGPHSPLSFLKEAKKAWPPGFSFPLQILVKGLQVPLYRVPAKQSLEQSKFF